MPVLSTVLHRWSSLGGNERNASSGRSRRRRSGPIAVTALASDPWPGVHWRLVRLGRTHGAPTPSYSAGTCRTDRGGGAHPLPGAGDRERKRLNSQHATISYVV